MTKPMTDKQRAAAEAIQVCDTKKDVVRMVGRSSAAVATSLRNFPELKAMWNGLPSGAHRPGPKTTAVPPPSPQQDEIDELVAEAVADLVAAGHPVSGKNSKRADMLRIIMCMFAITGSLNWPRGWVRSVMLALLEGGHSPTSAASVRWTRCAVVTDTEILRGVDGIAPELIEDVYEIT